MLLSHRVTGRGPPLLLVHSTATDSRMWDAQRDALATERSVVTPDLRGFGDSPLPPEPYVHARDVVALLDHLGIERTAVVASSGGGDVALQVASAQPERVSHLVLLCAAAGGVEPTPDVREFWARENALVDAGDIEGAARLNAETWLGPDADEAAREAMRAMQRRAFEVQLAAGDVEEDDLPVDLARLTMPVTLVTGAHDFEFFRAVARHLAEGLPDAHLVELAWAGHLPSMERPAETTELIRAAIAT